MKLMHFAAVRQDTYFGISPCRIGRQAIIKIYLPTAGKGHLARTQVAESQGIISDDPGSIAIFSLSFPVWQGKCGCAGLPGWPPRDYQVHFCRALVLVAR
jgi:hypothetical protein